MGASLPADRQNIVHGRDNVAHGTSEKTGDAIGGREDRITEATDRLANLLGRAAMDVWGDMPRDVQEALFEGKTKGHDLEREELARLLHDRHPKTVHPAKRG